MRAIVVGASGFGQVHVRELLHAGINRLDIVGSSPESGRYTAQTLSRTQKRTIRSFDSLQAALASQPDIVAICTPAALHAQQLLQVMQTKCAIICEKPFIWANDWTKDSLEQLLAELQPLEGRLCVNYCNSEYGQLARSLIDPRQRVESLGFRFHTNGHHRYGSIGVDLLPHALSVMQEVIDITNPEEITDVRIRLNEDEFSCRFNVGRVDCLFEFAQGPQIQKELCIRLNDRRFIRDVRVMDGVYQAGLLDEQNNERIRLVDPTRSLISGFVSAVKTGQTPPCGFAYAAQNTRYLHRIMNYGK